MKYTSLVIMSTVFIAISPVWGHAPITSSPTSCGALNSTDLATHVTSEIESRTSLANGSDDIEMYSTRGVRTAPYSGISTPWVRNVDFWGSQGSRPLDFTGAAPWADPMDGYTDPYQKNGALISPRHVLFANHWHHGVGAVLGFITNDNQIIYRTLVGYQLAGGDVGIGLLDSDVPDSVTYYPVIDSDDFMKMSYTYTNENLDIPVVSFNYLNQGYIRKATTLTQTSITHSQYFSPSVFADYSRSVIPGDSGSPGFIVIDGQPVVLFTHYSTGSAPLIGGYIDAVNTAMNTLGGGYQLTVYDTSCFDQYPTNHQPAWSVFPGNVFAYENTLRTTNPLFTVTATDSDIGQTVTYSLTSLVNTSNNAVLNPSDFFSIGSSDGKVQKHSKMDFETYGNGPFALTITATDNATYPGSNSYTTNIYLRNQNDAPVFGSASYDFSIGDNVSDGTSVGSISAVDADVGTTNTYSIASGNVGGAFAINASTGEITVANNAFTTQTYTLTAQVTTDSGTASGAAVIFSGGETNTVTVPVTIHISDMTAPTIALVSGVENISVVSNVLTMVYSEDLDESSVPDISSYTISINGNPAQVISSIIDGNTVTAMLDTTVISGDIVDVSYSPVLSPIQDIAGNDAVSWSVNNINNGSIPPAPDTPTLDTSSDTGVSSSDLITSDTTPTVNFSGIISGATISIYQDNTLVESDTVFGATYSYTPASPIESDGNVSFTIIQTVNNITSPLSDALIITLDTHAPDADIAVELVDGNDSGASVTDNITSDTSLEFTGTCTSGNEVQLFLDSVSDTTTTCSGGVFTLAPLAPFSDGVFAVTYTETDIAGNISAESPALSVTVDTTAPTSQPTIESPTEGSILQQLVSIEGECSAGGLVTITGDELIAPATGICDESVARYSILLNWNTDATGTQTLSVTHTDAAGNSATDPATEVSFTLDAVAPTLASSSVNASTLTLTMSETLDPARTPVIADFSVLVDGVSRTISSVNMSGNIITLTLASAVASTNVINVYYAPIGTSIADIASNDVFTFQSLAVTNTTTPVTPIGSSGGGGGGGGSGSSSRTTTTMTTPVTPTTTVTPTTETIAEIVKLQASQRAEVAEEEEIKYVSRETIIRLSFEFLKRFITNFTAQDGKNITFSSTDIADESLREMIATVMHYGIIGSKNTVFDSERLVTRSEAYAIILNSACIEQKKTFADWRKNVHEAAYANGFTARTWEKFHPNDPLKAQDLLTITRKVLQTRKAGSCGEK